MVARCYHRVCGRTFGGVTAFDRHLRLLREPPWTVCIEPSKAGLRDAQGVWSLTTPDDGFRRLQATPSTAGDDRG
jgi:hypothetical protein